MQPQRSPCATLAGCRPRCGHRLTDVNRDQGESNERADHQRLPVRRPR